MKKYRLTVFIISFALAMAVCMLTTDIAYMRQPSAQPSGELGLPECYYTITAEFSGTGEELAQNIILDKLFQAVSGDHEAIAIFSYDCLYLYDPSGYYNTEELNGGYFSKEDFLSGSEKGVLIAQNSPYSLMKENERIYCFGEYRDVVGEYSDDYPLGSWGRVDAIRCLGPGSLPGVKFTNGSVYSQSSFYLANCEKGLFDKVKEAFGEAGWTVTEASALQVSIYGKTAIADYLKYFNRNEVLVILLLIAMGGLVLRRAAYTGRKSTNTFRKGFVYGLIPSLTGCLTGNTLAALGKWLSYYKLLWEGILSAAGIVMGLMVLFMATAWIGAGKKEKDTHQGIAAWIKKVCVPVMSIILVCLTAWFSYNDMEILMDGIKQMKLDNMTAEVKGVQFKIQRPESIIKEPTGKLVGGIEQAMKEGKAFAFIQSNDCSCSIVIGSEAFRKTYKLDLGEELPAAYVSKRYERIRKDGSIRVGKYAKGIEVPVVKCLNDDTYRGLIQKFSDNEGPLVIMDTEDFMKSGYEIIDAVDNMCFVNTDSRTLNQYAKWLDELGVDYYMNRFGNREDDYYRVRLSVYGPIAIYIVMQVSIMLLFLAATVNIMVDRKSMEIKTALLYGAGFKRIWLKLLPLSAQILVPAGGVIGLIPILWSYADLDMFQHIFSQTDLIKILADRMLMDLVKGMATGLVLAAVVCTALAWDVWRRIGDSSQQF